MAKGASKPDKDFTGKVGGKASVGGLASRIDDLDAEVESIGEKLKKNTESQGKQAEAVKKTIDEAKKLRQEYEKKIEALKEVNDELEKQARLIQELEKKGKDITEEEQKKLDLLKEQKKEKEKARDEAEKEAVAAEKRFTLTQDENEELEKLLKTKRKLTEEEEKRKNELEEIKRVSDEGLATAEKENKIYEEGNAGLEKRKATVSDLNTKYERGLKRIIEQSKAQTSINSELNRATSLLGEQNPVLQRIAEQTDAVSGMYVLQMDAIKNNANLSRVEKEQQIKQLGSIVSTIKDTSAEMIKQDALVKAGKQSSLAAAEAIKDQYEKMEAMIQSLPTATKEQRAFKEQQLESLAAQKEMAEAAEKTIKKMKLLNNVASQFSGEGFSEINNLITSATQGSKAFKAALFAAGAGLGVLASKLIPALGTVREQTKAFFEIQKRGIQDQIEGLTTQNDISFINEESLEKRLQSMEGTIELGGKTITLGKQGVASQKEFLKLNQINLDIERSRNERQFDSFKNLKKINDLQTKGSAEQQKVLAQIGSQAAQNNLAFKVTSQSALFGKGLGSVKYSGDQLSLMGITAEQLGSDMANVGKIMGEMPTPDVAADMAMVAKRTGTSTEGVADLVKSFTKVDGLTQKTAINMVEGMRTMAEQANIPIDNLMNEVVSAQKSMLSYGIKNTAQLTKQVAYVQSMGLSFDKVAQAGKSMVMNYQDSIKAEMELSALLGEQVDLSEVRASFAAGDTEGALKALQAQGLNPEEMDMFQMEALQKSLGGQFDTSELTALLKGGPGANVGDLKAGKAAEENKKQIQQKANERVQQEIGSAVISAKEAEIQAELDQKILEEITGSKQNAEYLKKQAELQRMESQMNLFKQSLLDRESEMLKLRAEETSVETQQGMAEGALTGLMGVAGGIITEKLGSFATDFINKKMGNKKGASTSSKKKKKSAASDKKKKSTTPGKKKKSSATSGKTSNTRRTPPKRKPKSMGRGLKGLVLGAGATLLSAGVAEASTPEGMMGMFDGAKSMLGLGEAQQETQQNQESIAQEQLDAQDETLAYMKENTDSLNAIVSGQPDPNAEEGEDGGIVVNTDNSGMCSCIDTMTARITGALRQQLGRLDDWLKNQKENAATFDKENSLTNELLDGLVGTLIDPIQLLKKGASITTKLTASVGKKVMEKVAPNLMKNGAEEFAKKFGTKGVLGFLAKKAPGAIAETAAKRGASGNWIGAVSAVVDVGADIVGEYKKAEGIAKADTTTYELGRMTSVLSDVAAGAGIGAAIGSFIPVIGTAVGAVIGGYIGGLYGLYQEYFSEDAQKQAAAVYAAERANEWAQYNYDLENQSLKILEAAGERADFATSLAEDEPAWRAAVIDTLIEIARLSDVIAAQSLQYNAETGKYTDKRGREVKLGQYDMGAQAIAASKGLGAKALTYDEKAILDLKKLADAGGGTITSTTNVKGQDLKGLKFEEAIAKLGYSQDDIARAMARQELINTNASVADQKARQELIAQLENQKQELQRQGKKLTDAQQKQLDDLKAGINVNVNVPPVPAPTTNAPAGNKAPNTQPTGAPQPTTTTTTVVSGDATAIVNALKEKIQGSLIVMHQEQIKLTTAVNQTKNLIQAQTEKIISQLIAVSGNTKVPEKPTGIITELEKINKTLTSTPTVLSLFTGDIVGYMSKISENVGFIKDSVANNQSAVLIELQKMNNTLISTPSVLALWPMEPMAILTKIGIDVGMMAIATMVNQNMVLAELQKLNLTMSSTPSVLSIWPMEPLALLTKIGVDTGLIALSMLTNQNLVLFELQRLNLTLASTPSVLSLWSEEQSIFFTNLGVSVANITTTVSKQLSSIETIQKDILREIVSQSQPRVRDIDLSLIDIGMAGEETSTVPVVEQLKKLNTNTKTMIKLTRVLSALAEATFEGKTEVSLKLDGKQITYAVEKNSANRKGMRTTTIPGIAER